jgi:hypothetical protein
MLLKTRVCARGLVETHRTVISEDDFIRGPQYAAEVTPYETRSWRSPQHARSLYSGYPGVGGGRRATRLLRGIRLLVPRSAFTITAETTA